MAKVQSVEIMLKRAAPFLICLLAASAAHAQASGGHGRGGGRGGSAPSGSSSAPSASGPAKRPPTPVNQLQIIGVVKAIDLQAQRITIAYDAVEALNWPAGTQPFPVGKTAMLTTATVGEKVRFSLDGGQISALKPFDAP